MAYVGSTAMVTDLAGPAERAGAVGLMDLIASVSAAVGVLSGGALLHATGLVVLAAAALILLAAGAGVVVVSRERAVVRTG
jgi:MFS family permease